MIRLTQTTSFERVVNLLEDDADELETLALWLRRECRERASMYRSEACQDLLNRLEDIASDTLAEAVRMGESAGDTALGMACEKRWEE